MPGPAVPPDSAILSVSALSQRLKGAAEQACWDLWVSGEVSNINRHSSGHIYFSMKDRQATLQAALYRSVAVRVRFDLRDGMTIIAKVKASVYEQQGRLQLQIVEIHPKGIGALDLARQQLEESLKNKGYYDPRRKRKLPKFPKAIALVTSPTGAAIRDMLELLSRRWPSAAVTVVPVRVQGDEAAREIADAIRRLNRLRAANTISIDAMIVGRGGGSLEDLWAFNEEIVADAIFASAIPVISAVGHETDVSIADMVADHRALTPTHAVMDLTPDRDEHLRGLVDAKNRLRSALTRRIAQARQRVDALGARAALRRPHDRLDQLRRQIQDLGARLNRATVSKLERDRTRIASLADRLQTLSPLNVLARGYSVTQMADGRVVQSSEMLQPGDVIRSRLASGEVTSRVESVRSAEELP